MVKTLSRGGEVKTTNTRLSKLLYCNNLVNGGGRDVYHAIEICTCKLFPKNLILTTEPESARDFGSFHINSHVNSQNTSANLQIWRTK